VFSILHLIPTLEGGGAEKQLVTLASEQCKNGYFIHIGIRRGGENIKILNNGVTVHYLGNYKSLDPRLFLSILRLVREIKPSIIQTWLIQMDIVGGFVGIISKIPWIMTERTSAQHYLSKNPLFFVRNFLSKRARYIVANSSKGADYHISQGKLLNKCEIIFNSVDIKSIQNKRIFNLNNKRTILVVGRLIKSKNQKTTIKSISLLKNKENIELLIVGDGDKYKDEIMPLVGQYGLHGIVNFCDYKSDWWGLLRSSDMLVSMSSYEGSPNVVLEAMAGKCPLIVSDIEEHREILSDDDALFVSNNNINALALSIEDILNNKLSAIKRSDNAFEKIQEFTVENTVSKYEKLYKKIIDLQNTEV
jgi:glycosyltransferase involved in cell wall biosynthesis